MATITRPIFLLTDFGSHDHYVGQVKAVTATIAPGCMVYDLSHEVEPYAVEEGAWLLETSIGLLPENAVVVAVVDPGVGTNRRALVVQAGGRTFLGPDNGVLSGVLTSRRPSAAGDPALTPG
ncbi:MAG: SAM-dependent chlorinase/fluorinase, partial [Dehalococcoidia bacterium]